MNFPTLPLTEVTCVTTTRSAHWTSGAVVHVGPLDSAPDVIVQLDDPRQEVEGFGACFSEAGWRALTALDGSEREDVLRQLFAPGQGSSLSLCRVPIGANDFADDWYSHDEVPGDFALHHFRIDRDRTALIPFIRAAQVHQPNLELWASPWSPPTWMKANGHYAGAEPNSWTGGAPNGIRPDQVGAEGTDMMRQDDQTLLAYAEYFAKFIDAYRDEGIEVGMVMPQNEFNSAQPFPSCTWTPQGLARFIRQLGPRMAERDVKLFIGTLERYDENLLESALQDVVASPHIAGAGFQWSGRQAIGAFRARHPQLRIYQTEQECGNGKNDWTYARYAWSQIVQCFRDGTSAYMYWNIALNAHEPSTWGWKQNSLVVVDPETRTHRFTPDYHILRHVAGVVRPGARLIPTLSLGGQDSMLAFLQPNGDLVLVVQNDLPEDAEITFMVGSALVRASLPGDSLNSIVLTSEALHAANTPEGTSL